VTIFINYLFLGLVRR